MHFEPRGSEDGVVEGVGGKGSGAVTPRVSNLRRPSLRVPLPPVAKPPVEEGEEEEEAEKE